MDKEDMKLTDEEIDAIFEKYRNAEPAFDQFAFARRIEALVEERIAATAEPLASLKYLLDSYPKAIRVRPKGGDEDLLGSFCTTFIALRDAALSEPVAASRPTAEPERFPDARKEAAIAWEVCGSIHREYAKGKDLFFKTRQADFVKHAEDARRAALKPEAPTEAVEPVARNEDAKDAARYRWLREQTWDGPNGTLVATSPQCILPGSDCPSMFRLDQRIDKARAA